MLKNKAKLTDGIANLAMHRKFEMCVSESVSKIGFTIPTNWPTK